MLSDNVLCAIQVIDCLSSCPPNERGINAMMDSDINERIDAPMHLVKDVKSKMRLGSLIKRTPMGSQLCRSAEDITLMDLYTVMHSGIPLGSTREFEYRDMFNILYVDKYKNIRKVEDRLRAELKEHLESITISSLILSGSLYEFRK